MPRQARLDTPGTLHHVILRGIEKKNIFDDTYDRTSMIARMEELVKETGTNIYAWSGSGVGSRQALDYSNLMS